MNPKNQITKDAISAARKAGELLKKGFGSTFQIKSKKTVQDLVTEYDHASEKLLISFFSDLYPDSSFLAEESGKVGNQKTELEWIIDPLDGTVNFAHGIPVFSVSIAARLNGEVVSGVVYQPLLDELFVAEKNGGSFLNGKKLQVTSTDKLEKTLLATGFPYNLKDNPHHCIEHFTSILRQGIPIRRLGSAAIDLAYLAAGRFDGYFEVGLFPWDVAAGKLLVEEAGGKVTQWDENDIEIDVYSPILATNQRIHGELAKLLKRDV